jgi:hypothetical protein
MPSGNHVLNVCLGRYRFTVGLAACLMSGRVSLLHMPEFVRQLAQFRGVYPNVPNGAVSVANCLILWDFEIHEFHSKRPIFSIR